MMEVRCFGCGETFTHRQRLYGHQCIRNKPRAEIELDVLCDVSIWGTAAVYIGENENEIIHMDRGLRDKTEIPQGRTSEDSGQGPRDEVPLL